MVLMRQLSMYTNPWTPIVTKSVNYKRYQFPNAIFFRRRRLPMVIPRGMSYRYVKSRRLHKLYAARTKFMNNIGFTMTPAEVAWMDRYRRADAMVPDEPINYASRSRRGYC